MERNHYQNLGKMIELSEESWRVASANRLVDLNVAHIEPPFMQCGKERFINMCSCSYLGWDRHTAILEGAIDGIRRAGTLHLTTARCRLALDILGELEWELGQHFGSNAVVYNSCAAASSAALPLLASGALTDGVKPVMAFDKFAHFSLSHMKPLCGDETQVVTLDNNDMDSLESLCKEHPQVAYVSDGTYSISGFSDFEALKELQAKYGLFIYLDDSHGLSVTGEKGEGVTLRALGELNESTIVVASLAKAFGSAGGMLLSGKRDIKTLLVRYGNAWSQYLNSAGIGGNLASLKLHKSDELKQAQEQWRTNLEILDNSFITINAHTPSPIRVVMLKSPDVAVMTAKHLLEQGYYTSAVFFPVVPKNSAGIRVMPRADITSEGMQQFCSVFKEVCAEM